MASRVAISDEVIRLPCDSKTLKSLVPGEAKKGWKDVLFSMSKDKNTVLQENKETPHLLCG